MKYLKWYVFLGNTDRYLGTVRVPMTDPEDVYSLENIENAMEYAYDKFRHGDRHDGTVCRIHKAVKEVIETEGLESIGIESFYVFTTKEKGLDYFSKPWNKRPFYPRYKEYRYDKTHYVYDPYPRVKEKLSI